MGNHIENERSSYDKVGFDEENHSNFRGENPEQPECGGTTNATHPMPTLRGGWGDEVQLYLRGAVICRAWGGLAWYYVLKSKRSLVFSLWELRLGLEDKQLNVKSDPLR